MWGRPKGEYQILSRVRIQHGFADGTVMMGRRSRPVTSKEESVFDEDALHDPHHGKDHESSWDKSGRHGRKDTPRQGIFNRDQNQAPRSVKTVKRD